MNTSTPHKRNLKYHWAEWLVAQDKFDSVKEVLEADHCFACGFEQELQKAHILARSEGGSNEESNIHLLCNFCHRDSELISGETYYLWFKERNALDRIMASGVQYGFNTSKLIKACC